MCPPKVPKASAQGAATPPPAPQPVADRLTIDPNRKPKLGQRAGKSALVIDRSVGAATGGSGLVIGGG